jgi:hypothetical protein
MRWWLLLLIVMGAPTKDMIENADGAPCVLCGNTTAKSWWKAFDDNGKRRWLCAGTGEMKNRTGHARLHHKSFEAGWTAFESAPKPAPTVSSVAAKSNRLLTKKTRVPKAPPKTTKAPSATTAAAAATKRGKQKHGGARFIDDEAADDDDDESDSGNESGTEQRVSIVTTTSELGDEDAAARLHAQHMMGGETPVRKERGGASSATHSASIASSTRSSTSLFSADSVPLAHGKRVALSPPSTKSSSSQAAQLDSSAPPTRKRANQSMNPDESPAVHPVHNRFDAVVCSSDEDALSQASPKQAPPMQAPLESGESTEEDEPTVAERVASRATATEQPEDDQTVKWPPCHFPPRMQKSPCTV